MPTSYTSNRNDPICLAHGRLREIRSPADAARAAEQLSWRLTERAGAELAAERESAAAELAAERERAASELAAERARAAAELAAEREGM